VPPTREQRLLLAIVLVLFGIQVTLIGGGIVGLVLGGVALLVAASSPRSPRSGS
jgi:hypothetical protein